MKTLDQWNDWAADPGANPNDLAPGEAAMAVMVLDARLKAVQEEIAQLDFLDRWRKRRQRPRRRT